MHFLEELDLDTIKQLVKDKLPSGEGTFKKYYELDNMNCIAVLVDKWRTWSTSEYCSRLQKRLNHLRQKHGVRCHKLHKFFFDSKKVIGYYVYTKVPGEDMLGYYRDERTCPKNLLEIQTKRMNKLLAAPQKHLDEFFRAYCEIVKHGVLGLEKPANFKYDEAYGISFVDLDLPADSFEDSAHVPEFNKSSDIPVDYLVNIFSLFEVLETEESRVDKGDVDKAEYYGKRCDIVLKFAQGFVNHGVPIERVKEAVDICKNDLERLKTLWFLGCKPDFNEALNNMKPQKPLFETRATFLR